MSGRVLRPSSSGRWRICAGSVEMERHYPDPSGPAAVEGNEIHKIGAELIDLGRRGVAYGSPETVDPDAVRSAKGRTLEQIEAAWLYASDALDTMRAAGVFAEPMMGIEQRIQCARIHPDCYGTPDLWVYCRADNSIVIDDLKSGYGIVEPFECDQLICYAAGVLSLGAIAPLVNSSTIVHLRIFQPRVYHVDGIRRQWSITVDELRPYFQRLSVSAHAALGGSPKCTPSAQCRYCRAKHVCPALERECLALAEYTLAAQPDELDSASAGLELAFLEHAEQIVGYRVLALREQVAAALRRGEPVPDYSLEEKPGTLVWSAPIDSVTAVGDALGVELRKPDLITPTQARKAGVDPAIIEMYATRAAGKINVKRDDNTRARMIFGRK